MAELEDLLAKLGCKSVTEASAALTIFETFLGETKASTGKTNTAEALATLSARAAVGAALEKATGKPGDEAIGMVHAAFAAQAEVPKLQLRIGELEQTTQAHALDALFAKAKDDDKLTPAIEAKVREAYAAKEITLKGAESWLSNLTTIAALQSIDPPPANSEIAPASVELKHDGKTYAQLSGPERAALNKDNPDLFKQMRAGFKPARTN